jgi:hypothetical protein
MKLLARLRSWLRWIVNGKRLEGEMETEVRFHMESYTADLVRKGVPSQEAMRRARIEFGGSSHTKMLSVHHSACAGGMSYGRTFVTGRACCAKTQASRRSQLCHSH